MAVKRSRIEGRGAFTTVAIKKGQVICQCKGRSLSYADVKRRYESGKQSIANPLQVGEKEYMLIMPPYVYINHSCNPNCGIRKRGEIFALKNIKKGEELSYDYSTTEWTYENFGKYKEWAMECNCGARNCRGTIGQFFTLDPKTKKKYYKIGALQDFILRKLEKKMFS